MNTPIKKKQNTNSVTPNGQLTNNKRKKYISGKKKDLQNAIEILLGNSNNNIFNEFKNNFNTMSFDSRTARVNPNSALFMDKTNKKVYKIGLWDKCTMGIRKEYIAYKKIANKANSHKYVHTPKMLDCKIIPDTKYALLVITYQSALENAVPITNTQNLLYEEAEEFLTELGITHRDLLGNIYKIKINNKKTFFINKKETFFIIDFEDCIFINNNNFKLNNTSNEKLKNMDNKVKKLNSPPQTCVKNRKPNQNRTSNSPNFELYSSLDPSNLNESDPHNRLLGSNTNSTHGSPLKSPRRGGKNNKSKKK